MEKAKPALKSRIVELKSIRPDANLGASFDGHLEARGSDKLDTRKHFKRHRELNAIVKHVNKESRKEDMLQEIRDNSSKEHMTPAKTKEKTKEKKREERKKQIKPLQEEALQRKVESWLSRREGKKVVDSINKHVKKQGSIKPSELKQKKSTPKSTKKVKAYDV